MKTRMKICMVLLVMGLLISCKKEDDRIEIKMVYVEGGTFEMGSTASGGCNGYGDGNPVRTIRMEPYHISKYEITQGLWKAVMGTTLEEQRNKTNPRGPLYGVGDNYPMYYVSWEEAQAFCKRLSQKTGKEYALPTEAQWEYAARGGNESKHFLYAGGNDIDRVAWYYANSYALEVSNADFGTHPVGMKAANELGIYDMSGNVWEWCSDWYAPSYDESDTDNPHGPATGSMRVVRGGSWYDDAPYSRVFARFYEKPVFRYYALGFRVVMLP